MNELQIFENEQFGEIRTTIINDEPYFVGKDIAEALGYAKPQNAISTHVDEDDSLKQGIMDSLGRIQETTCINESGLYALVFGSKLPTAKVFKRWVTHEVLPALRKTGTYSIPNVTPTRKPNTRMRKVSTAIKDIDETAKLITRMFAVPECMALTKAVGMIEDVYEINLEPIRQLIPPAKHKTGFLTPTELGMRCGGKKAAIINQMLQNLGLQIQEVGAKGRKCWRLTDLGRNYGEEKPYDNKKSGHSGYQILWNENVISLLEAEEGVAK